MILSEVATELQRARVQHPTPWNSAYEGYAIILEELDELWDEVRRRHHECNFFKMREEAIQIAAMAVRFIEDVKVIHPAYKFASPFDLIATELIQDRAQRPQPLHSAHEGYALLSHAVCQLWESVCSYYDNGGFGVGAVMAIMAVKVGVAAVRFVEDVIDLPA